MPNMHFMVYECEVNEERILLLSTRNGVIRIREASLFDYACIAIKIPIK